MISSDHKPSVCFIALNAYNLLSGRQDINHLGGAEVQQVRMASWLVRRGYPVSFVTLDHGQPDGIDIDGITVRKAYAQKDGIPGLRFLHPRWSGLWAAMTRADADVYYQRGAQSETGQAALWCHLHGRKFVFGVASDANCDLRLARQTSWKEKSLYRLGLRLADIVTAQTTTQQRLLRERMGISAALIRNCGWESTDRDPCERPSNHCDEPLHALWVGRMGKTKRFEWLLDVAKKCPDIVFHVVGAANADSSYTLSLVKRAATISNVEMHGPVPYSQMAEYYRKCHVLCCTSSHEGFPNTFLEAWSLGIPVVSTFDPDGVVTAHGLGFVAQDVDGIVVCLRKIHHAPDAWLKASSAARQYYLTHHTPEVCLPDFERLLLGGADGRTVRAAS